MHYKDSQTREEEKGSSFPPRVVTSLTFEFEVIARFMTVEMGYEIGQWWSLRLQRLSLVVKMMKKSVRQYWSCECSCDK